MSGSLHASVASPRPPAAAGTVPTGELADGPISVDTVLRDGAAKTPLPAVKESHVQDLLADLEGKSETTQRPIIDEIVALGPNAIRPLSRALNSGSTFQVRMASATALGELRHDKCVQPLVQALADSSLNVQRAGLIGELTCTDISQGMLDALSGTAGRLGLQVETVCTDAERLPFPDAKGPAGLITAQLKQTPAPPSQAYPQADLPPAADRKAN